MAKRSILDWGARLADLYLLPEHRSHPTRDFSELRLRDHGCEIVSGLCEFYVTLHHAGKKPSGEKWAAKKAAYSPHVHEMLDRILAVGRNDDGLLYNAVDPQTGRILDARVSDSWGYVFDAYYSVWMVDQTAAYREAAFRPLGALWDRYRDYAWEPSGSAAGQCQRQSGRLRRLDRERSQPVQPLAVRRSALGVSSRLDGPRDPRAVVAPAL